MLPVSQESGRWLRTSIYLPPPLTFPWTTPLLLRMELVELQCNDELKAKFYNSSPLSFFRDTDLPSRTYPKYIAHFQRIVAMFCVTYCCEQLLSKMKYTKYRLRSLLSDRNLNDILLLSSSSMEPDIEILLHGKQHLACFASIVIYTSSFFFVCPRSEKVARPCSISFPSTVQDRRKRCGQYGHGRTIFSSK